MMPSVIFAFWAHAFEDEVGALHLVAFGELHFGDGQVFEADGFAAMLAMEMHMHVVVDAVVVAVAKLVAHAVAVFEGVDEMVLLEEREGAEDARLVDAADAVFQLAHREGLMLGCQCLGHDESVGRRPDVVVLE